MALLSTVEVLGALLLLFGFCWYVKLASQGR